MNITEYETGNHCFERILRINGKDYDELDKCDIKAFIVNMLDEDLNKDHLLEELFRKTLEYLQLDLVESSNDDCDQCGNWNFYNKYKVNKYD